MKGWEVRAHVRFPAETGPPLIRNEHVSGRPVQHTLLVHGSLVVDPLGFDDAIHPCVVGGHCCIFLAAVSAESMFSWL